jgi:diguanylate cyclase (GGDEF)-like protein/PAS domain S-box-containing protein
MNALTSAVSALFPLAIPVAGTAFLILAVGLRALFRRFTNVSVAFFTVTLTIAIWLLAIAGMLSADDSADALRWVRKAYLGVPFIPAAVYWFAVEILRIERKRRLLLVAAWSGAAFFSALALMTDRVIAGVELHAWGFYPRYAGAASAAFLLFLVGFLAASVSELALALRRASGIERKRIRLLLIALTIGCIACVDVLPNFGVPVVPFGFVPILVATLLIRYVIRKYDLVALTPSLAAQEIIGTMADALFVCDREGRIEFVNASASSLLGYDEQYLIGKRIDDLLATERALSSKLHRRSARNDEYVFATASGEQLDLTLSISPVIHDGEPAGAVIIGRDVRERKRSEREVMQAVTLLQSTLDSTADGILVVADRGRILSYNERFLEIWRIPATVMSSGDNVGAMQCIVNQLAKPAGFVASFQSGSAQPERESFDLLELNDGRRVERYSIARPLDGGETIRVWSFRDVTARFTAEAALRESEIRYRLLFEQNAAGVCVSGLDGVIADCNATFATMIGAPPSRIVGRSMSDLYANVSEADELIALLRSAGTLNSVEIELRRDDGRTLWVLENLVLVGDGDAAEIHATIVDISDRKRAEEQIEFHAYHDVLTHLPNRKLFTDRLRHSITRAKRTSKPIAVMFIDIDHFKTINDTLGHTAGDVLLLEMARRLRDCVREDDTVARLGGDEFTIILSDLRHDEDAVGIARKILATVQEPLSIGDAPITVTASIGIALYPVDGVEPESLLRNADHAMYRAKEEGRNTYQLCTDEMKLRAVERLAVETRLRSAVREEQLLLLYQPQVSLVTGRMIGVEALVRWNDPVRGIVEPESFIPIAEETRLILPLGEWVLKTACHQAKEWDKLGMGHLRVSVNLSARQFLQHDLVEMVKRAIDEAGLQPSQLELEITETTAMLNADVSVEVLRALRELGVGISIDDFGMGYSSLNYLKRFPLTAVKIDRAFVRDLGGEGGDGAIIGAVIGMARSLRLRVIAEGVETAEQFAFLRNRECDEAQGFYFSRPVSPEEVTRMMLERHLPRLHESRMTV